MTEPHVDEPAANVAPPQREPGLNLPLRRTVRGKLMRLVLFSTAGAVCVAGIAMLTHDLQVYRESWAADLSNEAEILALSTAPALEFDDHAIAQRNLEALRDRPRVLVAALYTATGELYAAYAREAGAAPPESAPSLSVSIAGERVELARPVIHDERRVGTIYLRARYDVAGRIEAYASIFFVVLSLSLALTFILSRRYQKSITEPLDAMTDVARGIVGRRDYTLRVAKSSDDEVGIVVRAFNGMLDEIESRQDASEKANSALQTEIHEREAAESALREADQRKDEFLATLAHELRNPLSPIRHAVKLLGAETASEEQRKWGRAVIARQVERMALLLDDLLDVSRITRGRLSLKIHSVALRGVVDAALEVAKPLIESRRQRLSVKLPEERITVQCDPLRLSQSLSNLITNAAKYTDEQGLIEFFVTLSPSELTFSVKDSGIGLDPRSIPTLFEMFSQLDTGTDRAEGGLGIGLALVKGLIELHGGRVEAFSAGIGSGSEFVIHLPRSMVGIEVDTPPAAEPDTARSAKRCKVVLADDNRDAVDSMALVLELAGYEVCVAHSGHAAVELAKRHRPQVMILDIGMPDMSGYDVAQAIRHHDWGGQIYLLAITGWGQAEDKDRARAAGFDRHLTKPVDLDTVERLLDEHLRSRSDMASGVS